MYYARELFVKRGPLGQSLANSQQPAAHAALATVTNARERPTSGKRG